MSLTPLRRASEMQFRPLSDWILVNFDPLKKRSGIIEIASDNDTSAVRTGTVLRTGPGRPLAKGGFAPMDVKEGDRITFLRWHQEHRPGKMTAAVLKDIGEEMGKDIHLIRQGDVLFVFDGDVEVDVP